jgi:5-methylcytosine-specific restriction enzyme A
MPNYLKHRHARTRGYYHQEKLYKSTAWRKYRTAFLNRQGGKCESCGDTPPDHMLHLDHIKPLAQGGEPFNTKNLQILCVICHGKKTAKETWGGGVPSETPSQ